MYKERKWDGIGKGNKNVAKKGYENANNYSIMKGKDTRKCFRYKHTFLFKILL